jgi:OOP family OmpA-OmpF porin
MKIKHLLLTVIALLTFSAALIAQDNASGSGSNYSLPKPKDFDRWSVGVSLGGSYLFGDLLKGAQNNNRFLDNGFFQPAFGLQVHHQVSHSIGIRARGMITSFKGSDDEFLDSANNSIVIGGSSGNRLWAVEYETPITEGALEMTYNFGNISFLNRNKNFHFVTTLGIGFFSFDTEVKSDSANSILLRRSGKITEIMVPASIGFKYKVGKIDLGMAFEYRKTFTDKVDATVKTFSEFDNYAMMTAQVNYTFGKKKPMEWVNPMEVVYNDLADLKEKVDIISGDKDKDGVSDLFDKDNSTPEGAKVYGDGTSIDTDGDGVIDTNDADPFSPKGAKVDAKGQEMDTDGDGVPDSRDLEPATASGSLVNFQGITIAPPGNNPVDSASGIAGAAGANGRNGVGYLPSVFFDLNQTSIKPIYNDRLLVIAKVMKANANIKLRVSGNTDILGSESNNDKLGLRRAESVKKHLITVYGIDGSRIITETKGEKDPMANKINAMNRRVDFSVE